jgi:hypothetical protein
MALEIQSVTLALENGENRQYDVPQGLKFDVDGRMVEAVQLRPGATASQDDPAALHPAGSHSNGENRRMTESPRRTGNARCS